MTATLNEVIEYLNQVLDPDRFSGDPSNNGLQVEGTSEISKAIFAVDSPSCLFAMAAERQAQFIFVHHGISWGPGFKTLTGITAAKLRPLMANDISLYASHLPLDAHPVHGHNAVMADMLDLRDRTLFCRINESNIGVAGFLPEEMSIGDMAETLADRLGSDYTVFGDEGKSIKNVGIVSGSPGGTGLLEARDAGVDCLVTGEISHVDFQTLREIELPVICLGHYISETAGVRRMMELVNARFGIDCEFIDLPTGL